MNETGKKKNLQKHKCVYCGLSLEICVHVNPRYAENWVQGKAATPSIYFHSSYSVAPDPPSFFHPSKI